MDGLLNNEGGAEEGVAPTPQPPSPSREDENGDDEVAIDAPNSTSKALFSDNESAQDPDRQCAEAEELTRQEVEDFAEKERFEAEDGDVEERAAKSA